MIQPTQKITVSLALFALTAGLALTSGNSFAQQKVKQTKKYYKVSKSDYMLLEDGSLYPNYATEAEYMPDYEYLTDYNYYTDIETRKLADTYTTDDYTITLTPGDSFPVNPDYSNIRYGIFDASSVTAVEKKYQEYFSKNDTSLTVNLANGRTKSYFSSNYFETMSPMMAYLVGYQSKGRSHQFQGYLKTIDAYLIYWEDAPSELEYSYEQTTGYMLVSRKNGTEISWESYSYSEALTEGIPVLSPDYKKILLLTSNKLRLYSISENGFSEEFNIPLFEDVAYGDYMITDLINGIKWKNENTILLNVYSLDKEAGAYTDVFKELTFLKK